MAHELLPAPYLAYTDISGITPISFFCVADRIISIDNTSLNTADDIVELYTDLAHEVEIMSAYTN